MVIWYPTTEATPDKLYNNNLRELFTLELAAKRILAKFVATGLHNLMSLPTMNQRSSSTNREVVRMKW